MTAYKDLQLKAKELGLPYIGIPREELAASITAKETSSDVVAKEGLQDEPSNTSISEPQATAPAEVSLKDFNTAIVLNNGREVRRYTIESHGVGFADLANEFAAKRKYTVELKKLEPGIKCPSCGHVFNPA